MKSIFKTIGYVLIYLFGQILSGAIIGVKSIMGDVDINNTAQYIMDNLLWLVILGNLISLFTIWVIDRWHHKNYQKRENKLNIKDCIIYVLIAFTFSMSFNLLMTNFGVENTSELFDSIKNFDNLAPNFGTIMFILAVIFSAPITEEYIFRYVVVNKLQDQFDPYVAIVISAFIFGLLHGGDIYVISGATLMGIIFGFIYVKTASLTVAILAHMAANSISLIFEFIPDLSLTIMIALSVVFALVCIGLIIYISKNSQIKIIENKRVAS